MLGSLATCLSQLLIIVCCGIGSELDTQDFWLQSEVTYEYFQDRFSVRSGQPCPKASSGLLLPFQCQINSTVSVDCFYNLPQGFAVHTSPAVAASLRLSLCMQGQQVYITYGQQSNDILLQYFGFVEDGASADDFKVVDFIKYVEEVAKPSNARKECLTSAGMLQNLQKVRVAAATTVVMLSHALHAVLEACTVVHFAAELD